MVDGSGILDRDLDGLPLRTLKTAGVKIILPSSVSFIVTRMVWVTLDLSPGSPMAIFSPWPPAWLPEASAGRCECDERQCQCIVLHVVDPLMLGD